MKYKVISPDARLSEIIKYYIVVYDITLLSNMLFLPNGGNFIVFNRGISGYSLLHNGEKHEIPKGYSSSIKTTKSKKAVLDLDNIPTISSKVIILVELLPLGFYKLFKEDASLLKTQYWPLENKVINTYFSKLYMHKNLQEDITYLNESFLQMYNEQNNSRELIDDILTKI